MHHPSLEYIDSYDPTPDRLGFFAETRAQWRAGLEANHASASGVCLVFNKKSSGLPHVSYEEGVEEALCFGWMDSKPSKVDDVRSSLYYAPRKPKSGWSRPNKERVEQLFEAALVMLVSLAKIEVAKLNGSWTQWKTSRFPLISRSH